MTRPANITAWLATEQPHIDLAYVGKDTTIADAKAEILRLDAEIAALRACTRCLGARTVIITGHMSARRIACPRCSS